MTNGWSGFKIVSASIVAIAIVGLAVTACDDDKAGPHLVATASPVFGLSIAPQQLIVSPLATVGCPLFPSFTTQFDAVLVGHEFSNLFLDQVTIHLLNGTNPGGSPVLMSASDLSARFGTTLIPAGGRRTFTFVPQFVCPGFLPQAIQLLFVVAEPNGTRQTTKMTVPFR